MRIESIAESGKKTNEEGGREKISRTELILKTFKVATPPIYGCLFGRVLGTRTDLVLLERQRSRLATKTSINTTSIT